MQRKNHFGFTLFEITFAIVIICLLSTIVVIGHDLTINSQVSHLEHDFRRIQTAIYDYQEVLRSKHGDVRKASWHLQDSVAPGNSSNLNSIIGGNWASKSGETFHLWQNVRSAGLAQGLTGTNPDVYVLLKSSDSVVEASDTFNALIAGIKGNYAICLNNIAGQLVEKLDLIMDDGNTASGAMMVSNSMGGTGIATDGIVKSATYLVCLGI